MKILDYDIFFWLSSQTHTSPIETKATEFPIGTECTIVIDTLNGYLHVPDSFFDKQAGFLIKCMWHVLSHNGEGHGGAQ